MSTAFSPALMSVIAFAAWTMIVLLAGVGTRRWYLILSRKAPLTSFPADTPHGCTAYRRAMRAHANCVENLPVYAAIVFVSEMAQIGSKYIAALSIAFILCRVAQSSVHMMLPETNVTVGIRFAFFFAQILIMFWMIAGIVASGFGQPRNAASLGSGNAKFFIRTETIEQLGDIIENLGDIWEI